ncbi:MAG: radical SAM protein [Sphingobacteriaceae bacterium]|nr:radical SAM protein [Sphingobacteriaceae bacterium]
MGNFINKVTSGKKLFSPGVQKPIYLLNFVTNSCNAACDHCFYWEELNTEKNLELSVQEHSKVAKSLGPLFQVTFTGGSPELRKDLPEIVYEYYKYCRPGNMTFCMLGYATERIIAQVETMLKKCKGQQITIGISLDGLGEEHDEYRKLKGLFDKVVNTINELHKLKKTYPNLRIAIGMVVHGLNIDKVENSALWVRNNLPIDLLKPILVRGNPINPDTKDEQCIGIYDKVVDRDRQWLMDHSSHSLNLTDKIIRAKENVQRDLIKKISSTKKTEITCSGGRETMVMYPSGNIAGCEMREDVLGNVRENDFDVSKIWFSDNGSKFRSTVGKVKECEGCYHHCFISPAIFRTPALWPKIAKSIMALNQ